MWRHLNHPFVLPFLGIDADTFCNFNSLVSLWMHNGTILQHLSRVGVESNVDASVIDRADRHMYRLITPSSVIGSRARTALSPRTGRRSR